MIGASNNNQSTDVLTAFNGLVKNQSSTCILFVNVYKQRSKIPGLTETAGDVLALCDVLAGLIKRKPSAIDFFDKKRVQENRVADENLRDTVLQLQTAVTTLSLRAKKPAARFSANSAKSTYDQSEFLAALFRMYVRNVNVYPF